jgi:hypothetical protein
MLRQKLCRFPKLGRLPKGLSKKGTIIAKQQSNQFIPKLIAKFFW